MIAVVTVKGHTSLDLETAALKTAAPLFQANARNGAWYGYNSYTHKLAIIGCPEVVQAADGRDGWEGTFRVGLVPA